MSGVLTTASTLSCGHPPGVVRVAGSPRLTVERQGVLTADAVAGAQLEKTPDGTSRCGLVPVTAPPTKKCTLVTEVTGGTAARLTVGGVPVMVEQGFGGLTDGVVGGTRQNGLTAVANLTILEAR